jgi:hypothetical protein
MYHQRRAYGRDKDTSHIRLVCSGFCGRSKQSKISARLVHGVKHTPRSMLFFEGAVFPAELDIARSARPAAYPTIPRNWLCC